MDINVDHSKKRQMLAASLAGDLEYLKELVEDFIKGGGIGKHIENVIDDITGRNCLHNAASTNNLNVCKYVIGELHFNINKKDAKGYTALDLSLLNKDYYVTSSYLLNQGADHEIHVENVHYDNDLVVIERLVDLKMKGNKSNAIKLVVEDIIEDKRLLYTMALKAKDFSNTLRLKIKSSAAKWLDESIKEVGEILAVRDDGCTLLAYDLDLERMWDPELIKLRGTSKYTIEGGGLLDFINNHQLNEGDKISFYTKYIPVFGPIFAVGFTRKEVTLDEVKRTNAILNPEKKAWQN